MLLIGSRALQYYGNQYLCPEVKRALDTDLIATYDQFVKFKDSLSGSKKIIPLNRGKNIALITKDHGIFDFEISWNDGICTADSLLTIVKENKLSKLADEKNNIYAVNPDVIFTLKKSHRFLRNSPHFLKTMNDYKWLRDHCNCKVPEVLNDWLKLRNKETYWYKHPNLNTTKDEFFQDIYKYDHDSVHVSVSHLIINGKKTPAYTLYKDDKDEVKCNKDKFNALPENYRLYGVLEEAYVLAIERSQVPFPNKITGRDSFIYALNKVCTSITSGWFREFAYDNYNKVIELYNDEYLSNFWNDVKSGKIKHFTESKY